MALEIFRLVGSVFVDTDKANKSLKKTDDNAVGFGKTLLKGVGTAAKWAAGVAAAAGVVATGIGAAASKAVDSYAEYEQLVGGVETLFKDGAKTVIKNAEKAYKTAGMTASNYMNTVTSFSASLLQSLGGDTEAAAKYADMAITDMADNANKMGTSIDLLQNAYGGFAKQNYSMLDNLKLGYGGCKTEMERLLKDAQKLTGVKYDINNLSDVYEAIHVIQGELGITGATAAEATSTIEGGLGMIKAKIGNLVTKIGGSLAPAAQSVISLVIDNLPRIEAWVDRAIPFIAGGIERVVEWLSTAGDRVDAFITWLRDLAGYASTTLGPIISDLAPVFQAVRDALKEVRDALNEYFTSGQAAEDATQFLKDAIKFLADAYAGAKDLIGDIVQGFKDTAAWARENETAVGLVAIAMGTLTAALVAYNIAQAIKNAGGIVEIAQLAATAVGLGALTVAETAHTVAATVGTAVTTAFGAAVAFLTSPITLVVLAIGALIAIIYLLVKNWDTVKEAAAKCWEWIKGAWSKASEWFNTNIIQPIAKFFSGLWSGMVSGAKNTWSNIRDAFASAKSWFTERFEGVKNGVKNAWTGMVTGAKNAWSSIKGAFSNAKSWFSNLMNGVKNVFSTVAKAIGGIFKSPINTIIKGINGFTAGLNKIKIPDWVPSVGGKGFSIASIPYLEKGGVLEKGQTGFLEGNGAEAVVPLHQNKKWISAVARDMSDATGQQTDPQVVSVLNDILVAITEVAKMGVTLDTGALVGGLAKPMDRKLGQLQAQKARA